MERPRIVTRALLITGLSLAGAFGNPTRSEAIPPKTDGCNIIQIRGDTVLIVCPYTYRPEADIERVKEKCLVTGTEISNHRSSIQAILNTDLQKNCWGPQVKDSFRTAIKYYHKVPPRIRR